MKCETISNMMSSYIDGYLNEIEKAEFEKHIAECGQCKEEYESMLDIITACGNMEEVELPQNFRTELHQKLAEEKKKKLFSNFLGRKGSKMAAGLVAAALVIAIGIGGPSLLYNNNAKMSEGITSSPGYGGAAAPAAEPAPPSVAMDSDMAVRKFQNVEPEMYAMDQPQITAAEEGRDYAAMEFNENALGGQETPKEAALPARGRLVIRTGNLSVDVASVDKATAEIKQLAESSGGYVQYSQTDIITSPPIIYEDGRTTAKEYTEKYSNMTVRVPENKFEGIFNNIKGMGKLVSENISGNDITAEYRDTTARVENLKIQEQSLQQLMSKANTVDEILKIETELNRVRTDIDILSGNLKRWDDLVQLSTINIHLRELKPEELKSVDVTGIWEKAYQGFIKAVNNIVRGLEALFVMLITAVPYLIIAGVLAAAGIVIAKRIRQNKK
jgi:hypothetical protein